MILVLYIFFKIFLKSKIIPAKEIDFETEFAEIRLEKSQASMYETENSKPTSWFRKVIHWI